MAFAIGVVAVLGLTYASTVVFITGQMNEIVVGQARGLHDIPPPRPRGDLPRARSAGYPPRLLLRPVPARRRMDRRECPSAAAGDARRRPPAGIAPAGL